MASSRKGQRQQRSYDRKFGLRFDRLDDGTVRVRMVREQDQPWLAAIATDEELVDIGTIRRQRIPVNSGRSGDRWLAYTPSGKPKVLTKTRQQAAEMLLAVWKEAQR